MPSAPAVYRRYRCPKIGTILDYGDGRMRVVKYMCESGVREGVFWVPVTPEQAAKNIASGWWVPDCPPELKLEECL